MRAPHDPSRTSLFYWVLTFAVSIVISLAGYALLRLTLHAQAITALETWRDIRSQETQKELLLLHQVRDTLAQHSLLLTGLQEQARVFENTLKFHEAQLEYVISWEKRQFSREPPIRQYPR